MELNIFCFIIVNIRDVYNDDTDGYIQNDNDRFALHCLGDFVLETIRYNTSHMMEVDKLCIKNSII